jgi:hypothetical protein
VVAIPAPELTDSLIERTTYPPRRAGLAHGSVAPTQCALKLPARSPPVPQRPLARRIDQDGPQAVITVTAFILREAVWINSMVFWSGDPVESG